jgi:hypothetical protein
MTKTKTTKRNQTPSTSREAGIGVEKVLLMTMPLGSFVAEALDHGRRNKAGRGRNKRNPVEGLTFTTVAGVQALKVKAKLYDVPALVRVFPATTPNEVWPKAGLVEAKGKHGTSLEVFGVVDQPGTYGYAPDGWVDQVNDEVRREWEREREKALAKSRTQTTKAWAKVADEYGKLGEKYVGKLEKLVGEYEKAAQVVVERLQMGKGLGSEEKATVGRLSKDVEKAGAGAARWVSAVRGFMRAVVEVPEMVEYDDWTGARRGRR